MFSSYSTCHNYLLSIMDMRVPFEVAAISMKCDYKAGSQCGFLSFPFGFPF